MSNETFAGVGTSEYVALKLLEAVAQGQQKAAMHTTGAVSWKVGADKDWILDTYAECLEAAIGGRRARTR